MLQELDDNQPEFKDEVPPANEMGPIDAGKPGGKKNSPGKRAKATAAAVVYGDPIAAAMARHEALVQEGEDTLNDMSRRTEDAIAKENDSRVQQVREQDEREHEKEMERIRQQGALERLNAIHAQRQAPQSQPSEGSGLRHWNPQTMQWEYGNTMTIGPRGTFMS